FSLPDALPISHLLFSLWFPRVFSHYHPLILLSLSTYFIIAFAVSSIALSETSITGQPIFPIISSKYTSSSSIRRLLAYIAVSFKPSWLKRSLRILYSVSGLILSATHLSGLTSNSSDGGLTSGTSGTFITLYFFSAKNCDSGVFDVLDTPRSTISAFSRPLVSLPSSYLTANSIA